MKTFLVPTDFSDLANQTVLLSLKLAKKMQAKVILLHTYNLPVIDYPALSMTPGLLYTNVDMDEFEGFKKNTEIIRQKAVEQGVDGVEIIHQLVLGELNTAINECLVKEQIELLIMGTSGGNDWFSKILGSNTDSILLNTTVPVLILPENGDVNFETLAFTTTFNKEDKLFLESAITMATALGMCVKCFYIDNLNADIQGVLEQWKVDFPTVMFHVHKDTNVIEGLKFLVNHYHIDLLSTITHKRDFFTELFTTRLTQRIEHAVNIPLLVFPSEQKA